MVAKFKTVDWAATANIYEVNLRQYTAEGTLEAFKQHLPRLKDMGVNILWFMPLTPISLKKRQGSLGSYYACSNYNAISEEYGKAADFKDLVAAAHEMGFKVIIDWVANHTGYDHVWTKEHPEFYKKNNEGNFYDAFGWIDVIDLDYYNRQLWDAMIAEMNEWIKEFDIDGFRCDMANLVPLDFWFKARSALDAKKELFWLAECEDSAYHQVFDATYAWEFLHTMEAVAANNASPGDLKNVLEKNNAAFPANALRLFFTSNHDENSHSGSEYERLGEGAEAFAVLCATWNSLPLIYSGQEMPNKKRLKFFDKDAIEWTETYLLHDFYKTLLSLKKSYPAMQSGNVAVSTKLLATTAPGNVFVFVRNINENELLVILNLSNSSDIRFEITGVFNAGKFINAFSGQAAEITAHTTFQMQKWEYLVYIQNHDQQD